MDAMKPEYLILTLLSIILILGGYIIISGYSINNAEMYEKGVLDGRKEFKAQILEELLNDGFTTQTFKLENRTVTVRLFEQPSFENMNALVEQGQLNAYQQGILDGRTLLATDLLGQLQKQGYAEYNFTDGESLLPVRLAPIQPAPVAPAEPAQ